MAKLQPSLTRIPEGAFEETEDDGGSSTTSFAKTGSSVPCGSNCQSNDNSDRELSDEELADEELWKELEREEGPRPATRPLGAPSAAAKRGRDRRMARRYARDALCAAPTASRSRSWRFAGSAPGAEDRGSSSDSGSGSSGEDSDSDGDEGSHARARAVLFGAETPEPPPPLDDSVPSVGSLKHASGDCLPCAFFGSRTGCINRRACAFCHFHTKTPKPKVARKPTGKKTLASNLSTAGSTGSKAPRVVKTTAASHVISAGCAEDGAVTGTYTLAL